MNDDKYTIRLDRIDRSLNEIKMLLIQLLKMLGSDKEWKIINIR